MNYENDTDVICMTVNQTARTMAELVDHNDHTEALRVWAIWVLEPELVVKLESIAAEHKRLGYMTQEMIAERRALQEMVEAESADLLDTMNHRILKAAL